MGRKIVMENKISYLNLNGLIIELTYNLNVSLDQGIEPMVDIEYILERLKDIRKLMEKNK